MNPLPVATNLAADTVAPRNILFVGGTGVISAAAAELAVALGHRLTILNRGQSTGRPTPEGAEVLHADIRDSSAVREVLQGREFDAVADFIAFTPDHARASMELFRGRTGQYVFISSASAYQKPPTRLPILESTPLKNPFWQYSRDKIACEDVLFEAYRSDDFPLTVVRPSHTYDRTKIAMVGGWTDIHRMRQGLPILVHGDGTSLWTLTHSRDFAKAFVGLLGRPQAVGESYTITSDEYLPWNQIYQLFARAAGVPGPQLVHVASETIAAHNPVLGANLLGDRSHSVVFDNTKIKSLVPSYAATIPFADGAREIVAWYDSHPDLQVVDQAYMELSDKLTGIALASN
ncbi:NAD-dependent epimerase/dehydratase family protein [Pseudarthrobacter sp. J75]|uniref:NAD-dependent epimerase/dehydratase family protein n=1 Tax=unclassified Pseudarthrobacter TaxID=2647000 RepID=UPI002E8176A2|nr:MULTISPECIES: NAD-dependent epimerase/dehydratase family protein [unclassified Pseudarthrobacter]MEE2521896.1 NAD-dependent epimerase/dehydratase family protein [Pseudarthrobacter sp. J47]MEE2528821.1 NAD-dependent epimerase/dehydratase family protein [Pseudarthrobacter sp. J75]